MAEADQEFDAYFRARRDAVRRSAYLLCGDWHRADDHAQAAFVALHRHWRRIRDRAALDAWMRRTLVRSVVDESRRPWRRERSTDEVSAVPSVDGTATAAASPPGTCSSTACARCRRASARCWCCGSSKGWTSRRPPRRSGARQGTVKSQTAHGLAALRAALGDALDDLRPAG